MRNTSTVSGPLLSVSSTAPAGQQNRFAAVHLLTGQLLYFIVEGKSRVKDVNVQMATYMTAQGMQDVELFSLAIVVEDEFFFTDPESKLSKYSPKGWKSSSTHGLDQNGQPLLRLHLRVKYYVETTKFLRDEISREYYYLQLRENIAARGGTMEDVNHKNVLHLVALALQADLGDHTADMEISTELLEKYLPPKAYKNNEHKVKQTLSTLHKNHKGLSKSLAQTMFVQQASPLHKAHLYRMKLNKSQPKQLQSGALSTCNNAWLAIFNNGIQLFHEGLSQALSCLYLWSNVMRLCFDRKKFELRTKTKEMLVYYADSEEKCKRIVMVCQHTIEYNRPKTNDKGLNNNTTDKSKFYGLKWTNEKKSKTKLNNNDLISKKANDTNDEKICSENGDCSDSSILTADKKSTPTINLTTNTTKKVSNGSVSSNEDLGYGHMSLQNSVESELDYSVQSAQDSSEAAYLMYRNPRARTAYVDNSNQSANTSSGVYTCASYSTVSKDTASASYTTENCSSADCNGIGDNYCKMLETANAERIPSPSTVFARSSSSAPPPPQPDHASLQPDAAAAPAGDGATAAVGKAPLEAAATAVATAVDDCDGRGCVDGAAELYDLSATSEGSYCAGGGATATTASDVVSPSSASSSKCGDSGCDSRCALNGYADANGRGRSRSGSVVSNSGSFHGDGSDPPEGGRGAQLLSAAELSDLIVGRDTLQTPRKGYYPSRPTTSSTLDSDSDYVTLPPPMNFITGAPSLSNLSLTNFDCGTGTSGGYWDVRRSFDLLSSVVKVCGGHQCVVNSNNYLDVHKSGAAFYHHIIPTGGGVTAVVPPMLHARQPPPPPPPPRPKQFDFQLEQYKQQLQSNSNFVVYPHQDPAISHQEYVDAKCARDRVHQQHYCCNYYGLDPPRYQANPYLYRSTPNVASGLSLPPPPIPPSLSSASSSSLSHHLQYQCHRPTYIQNQHLPIPIANYQQQFQVQQPHAPSPSPPPVPPHIKNASNQSLLFPATVAASAEYAARNPHRPRPMYPMPFQQQVRSSYSHDDLLAATRAPAVPPKLPLHRRPPPPPPPLNGMLKPPLPTPPSPATPPPRYPSTADACTTTAGTVSALNNNVLDIESLREKSRNLDLPLISALCNDQTLLKQTNTLPTENKATQTVPPPSPLAIATMAAAAAATAAADAPAKASSHQHAPPTVSSTSLSSSSSSSLPPSNKEQKPQSGSVVSICVKCTNSASSSSFSCSSPPPPSLLSAATPTSISVSAAAVKSVKSVKSKTNHVKTNTNNI